MGPKRLYGETSSASSVPTKAIPTEMRMTLSDRMKSSIVHSVNKSNLSTKMAETLTYERF